MPPRPTARREGCSISDTTTTTPWRSTRTSRRTSSSTPAPGRRDVPNSRHLLRLGLQLARSLPHGPGHAAGSAAVLLPRRLEPGARTGIQSAAGAELHGDAERRDDAAAAGRDGHALAHLSR